MASRIGNRVVGGADKALDLLRTLPRVSLGNLKSNPKAFQKVIIFHVFIFYSFVRLQAFLITDIYVHIIYMICNIELNMRYTLYAINDVIRSLFNI